MYARHLFVVVGIFGDVLTRKRASPERILGIPSVDRIYAGVMNDASQITSGHLAQAVGLPQLSVVIPTFNERDNVTTLFRRLENDAGRHRVGSDLRRRQFARRYLAEVLRALSRRRTAACAASARIGRRGLSGACIEGMLASSAPLRGGDRRRLAARRNAIAEDARASARRRVRSRGRQSLHRRRQRRQFQSPARGATAVRDGCRASGRLQVEIADPMSGFFMIRRERFEATCAEAVDARLQDPARRGGDRPGHAPRLGNALTLRLAGARREQARLPGGAGIPRPRAREADPRSGRRCGSCCSRWSARIGLVVHLRRALRTRDLERAVSRKRRASRRARAP